ncbi:MAG: gamma-glutamyltransferase [Allosphingosinicella sp.]|uniref:gamma-glutamyltransferase n=1 Tax=Allosphingosinicella sp. TaxID=2823234 RepID=UPI00393706A8
MKVGRRDLLRLLPLGLILPSAGFAAGGPEPRRVHSNHGFGISTNHPLVTEAARSVRLSGGNAFDMFAAAIAASWVADPANSSPFGRMQGVNLSRRARWTLHAATGVRRGVESTVPVPGNISALFHFREAGLLRLPLARSLRPAIAIARGGYTPSEALRAIVAQTADDLGSDLGAIYLDAAGTARGRVRNPALARLLELLGRAPDERGFWRALAAASGGALPWSQAELEGNRAVRGQPRSLGLRLEDGEVELLSTANLETWGSWTLLGIAVGDRLRRSGALSTSERSAEAYVLASILTLERIPFAVGTLVPKTSRPSVAFDLDDEADRIAARVAELLDASAAQLREAIGATYFGTEAALTDDRNTTHFSIADPDWLLSYTTSIGPWFGSKTACSGAALGYSYAMRSGRLFEGQERDVTELSPIVALRNGTPWLAIGAAGSERILGALTYIFFRYIAGGDRRPMAEIMADPRLFPKDGKVRIHHDFPEKTRRHLLARGFALSATDYRIDRHLGIVNLVECVEDGLFRSGADPSSSGAAF